MTDIDKVKDGLKRCLLVGNCDQCAYRGVLRCRHALLDDANELLAKVKPYESRAMLPCVCGGKSREHWYGCDGSEQLICKRCGKKVSGISGMDVIRKWNKTIQEELASKTPL